MWLDGEWTLKRGRWAWRVGRWVVPPKGAVYSPWTFVRALDGSIFFAPGAFWDADGKAVLEPPPLALAKAGTVAVIDPEGNTASTGRTLAAQTVTDASVPLEPADGSAPPRLQPDAAVKTPHDAGK